ncbi:phage tail spike protein [Clostridium cellulovorans]|uniref:Phage minor structural protein n=1 Tax=Clostridium cellulovorans (strain ATCC 35296 / DSM 3052 / OCM 3 / 743B) TaxID=573061 RepID=D9SVZ6_CLOC7|nr:phage tail spike protein [Clostridium cellulovorans]ADL53207.1 phage minor structural protein [Clostridium cellulovorans 743B]
MKKEIKIAYFPSTALKSKVLTSNGTTLDNYCTKCETEENLNTGGYTLDATFLLDVQQYLEEENILKVKMDYGDEVFRISKVTKGTRYIDVVARQITIAETLNLYLSDVRPMDANGQAALSHLLTGSTGIKEITFASDITTTATAYYEDMSLYKALQDSDNSFLKVWGGEVLRRAYNVTINQTIGIDRGVTIREGKNLIGFNGTSNIDSLVTRARGKGFNGIKGNWVDSPLINNYARVYTKTIEYQDVKVKSDSDTEGYATEALAKAELDRRITLEYSENDIDKIKATYDVNFVQLEKTEEYKNYAIAERVFLGDTLRVYISKLDTDIKVRAVVKKYDVLAQKTKELTLSNAVQIQSMNMNDIISDLRKQYEGSGNNSIAQYIDSIIKSGMKDSYVVVRDNEILVMDTKDINTATVVTRLNKQGIGFSSTGYYGTYKYGFTLDGVINASLISTGILNADLIKAGTLNADLIKAGTLNADLIKAGTLNADLIKAGTLNADLIKAGTLNATLIKAGILSTIVIQNADGSFKIDLSGAGGAKYYNNGKIAMEMSNNQLKMYNWALNGDYVGSIGSLSNASTPNKPSLGIWNDVGGAIQIGYQTPSNGLQPYMRFDKYNVFGDSVEEIKLYGDVDVDYLYGNTITAQSFRGSNLNTLNLECDRLYGSRIGQSVVFSVDMTTKTLEIQNLSVLGNKNCIQRTENYGKVPFYANEDINSLLTKTPVNEIHETKYYEETNSYKCIIKISDFIRECINTETEYNVWLSKLGKGDLWIANTYPGYFIIESNQVIKFKYKIEGMRKNFEEKTEDNYLKDFKR